MPLNIRVLLAKTLVLPFLDYCAALYLGLNDDLAKKMRRAKNASLRFITGVKKFEHISQEYPKLNIMEFDSRVQYIALVFLAKILVTGEPMCLSKLISFKPPGRYNLKNYSRFDLQTSSWRTDAYKKSFAVYAPLLWNQVPAIIRSLYREKPRMFKLLLYDLLASNKININNYV